LADSGGRDLGWRAAHGLLCAERGDRAKAVELLRPSWRMASTPYRAACSGLRGLRTQRARRGARRCPGLRELYRVLAPHRGRQWSWPTVRSGARSRLPVAVGGGHGQSRLRRRARQRGSGRPAPWAPNA
jgi:hypothetical protein